MAEGDVAKPKVMVALRDADSLETLITLACQVSSGMEAELIALHVVELPLATPIEADDEVLVKPGREILSRAERLRFHRGRNLTEVTVMKLRARVLRRLGGC